VGPPAPISVQLQANEKTQIRDLTISFGEHWTKESLCVVHLVHKINNEKTEIEVELQLQAPDNKGVGERFMQVMLQIGFLDPGM